MVGDLPEAADEAVDVGNQQVWYFECWKVAAFGHFGPVSEIPRLLRLTVIGKDRCGNPPAPPPRVTSAGPPHKGQSSAGVDTEVRSRRAGLFLLRSRGQ